MAQEKVKARRVLSVEEYLQVSRDQAGRVVRELMEKFDFEKAHRAMLACNWKFVSAQDVMTVDELRKMAEKIVHEAMEYGSKCEIQSGPLVVRVGHYDTSAVPHVTLQLVPVYSSAVYVDARKIVTKKMIGLSGAKATQDKTKTV